MMSRSGAYFSAEIKLALEGFDLSVEMQLGNELGVVFGPSGSGKSLLLRTIAGLLTPDQGRIEIGDRVLLDTNAGVNLAPQERQIGYMPQKYALFPHLNVTENICFGLFGWDSKEREKRLRELIEVMRLDPVRDRFPNELSGGEQQRTALARAIAPRPSILLMDEPFAALDEILREHLREELVRIQRRFQIPVLLVTHNLAEAYTLADRVMIFEAGSLTQQGSRDDVFRRPATPQIARLMAMENVISVPVREAAQDQVHINWWGQEVVLGDVAHFPSGESLTIGIRPEDIMIVRKASKPLRREGDIFFDGKLVKDQARGFDHQLTFHIQGTDDPEAKIIVRVPHPTFLRLELNLDELRTLVIRPKVLHLFNLV